jgi:hypothetical protein
VDHAIEEFGRTIVAQYGPVPVIGGFIAAAALCAVFAYKLKEESRGFAIALASVAAVLALVALGSWPAAAKACRTSWKESIAAYTNSHCEVIVHCVSNGGCD